jgi:ribosomal protein S18 acetylase RimI-like enzyme
MSYTIRAAKPADYAETRAVYAELHRFHYKGLPHAFRPTDGPEVSRADFLEWVTHPEAALFVAESEGRLLGLVRCVVRVYEGWSGLVPRRVAYVPSLGVRREARGMGIGRALMERVHQWAGERGLTTVELDVWEFNGGARAFYETLGYQTTRRMMARDLSDHTSSDHASQEST